MKRRILFKNNTTISDWTNSLFDYFANTVSATIVAAEDNIYIGASLPFNHFYIDASGTNTQVSDMSVQVWDGNDWEDVAEITDGTAIGGATLAQSGHVEFVPDKNEGWFRDDTVKTGGDEEVTDLGNVTIYDQYWVKISFSADLDAVDLNWIGSIYSNDNDLKGEFPDLTRSSVITALEISRSDYFEQHAIAARNIEKDLIKKNYIIDENQILTREDLTLASVQKVATIVYNMLGDDYTDNFTAAEKEYTKRLANAYVKTDRNSNGRVDQQEQRPVIGMLLR